MSEHEVVWQERRLEEILSSNIDPVSKAQQIIKLGFDPEIADEIVDQYQTGMQRPVYYERLNFADLDNEELYDEPLAADPLTETDPLTEEEK